MGLFYGKFFKQFWKEILVTFVLGFLTIFLTQMFLVMDAALTEFVGLYVFLATTFATLVPVLPGLVGAWLASRKEQSLKAAIFVPAIGLLFAALLIGIFNFSFTYLQAMDPVSEYFYIEMDYPYEYGLDYEDYTGIMLLMVIPETITIMLANFGIGILAGLIWMKQLCLRGKLKREGKK